MRRPTSQCLMGILLILAGVAMADEGIDLQKGREFWAFRAPVKVDPPAVERRGWPRSEIDRFLLAKLEAEGQAPPRDLGAQKLVRRIYFDLIGLPPTPAQIDTFLADTSPGAFGRLVDRLLASPQFGERWGRHWLDVVRFAESTGGGRTMLLKDSWRYRDYVVDAFNQDKPYDDFVTEQIAGDLLSSDDPKKRRGQLVATTFLALGPSNYELQDKAQLRMEIVDEQVDTVGRAFMAMTLGCARCHDHMFDPISTRDYYALAGVFHSTKTVEHANVSTWLMADLPPITRAEKHAAGAHAVYRQRLRKTKAGIAAAELELAKLDDPSLAVGIVVDDAEASLSGGWVDSTVVKRWVGKGYIHDNSGDGVLRQVEFEPGRLAAGRYEVRVSYSAGPNRSTKTPVTIRHGRGETTVLINQRNVPEIGGLFTSVGIYEFAERSQGAVMISNDGTDGVTIVDAVQWVPAGARASRQEDAMQTRRRVLDRRIASLHKGLAKIARSEPKLVKVQTMTVRDEAKPGDMHLALRGDIHRPGELVPRGFPEVIEAGYRPSFTAAQSGRLELARWLTADDHPLTARVMANRLWEKLMGDGLVETPDNFGSTGGSPTHPQLLDWLSLRLIENGWSLKQTLREMVLSRTYQAERARPRRLDAESLRDAMLAVSGDLDRTLGGLTIRPGTESEFGYDFKSRRRSLYLPVFRNSLPDLFAVFDFPDPNLVAGKRHTSTLATQALYFMNHPFVIEQAGIAADSLVALANAGTAARIKLAYRRALGRLPSGRELTLAEGFLGTSPGREEWRAFCQSLFACIDFRYVE